MTFILEGKLYRTNSEGYLVDQDEWSCSVAEFMATQDQCVLTKNHWAVIYLIRNYYYENEVAPGVRLLVKQIGKKLGKDKANSRYLYQLFTKQRAK